MDTNELRGYFLACLGADYQEEENWASWAWERRGEELVFYFEGSNGAQDWLSNLNFHAVPYREMNPVWQCHGGFLKVWKSIHPALEARLNEELTKGAKTVRTVGFSHGAAIAVFCHEWIWYHYPQLRNGLESYAFGCPRVIYGCLPPTLARRWDRFYVIRNLDDAITHLPPRVMGYCHVGNLVEIGTLGKYSAIDAHRPQSYLSEL